MQPPRPRRAERAAETDAAMASLLREKEATGERQRKLERNITELRTLLATATAATAPPPATPAAASAVAPAAQLNDFPVRQAEARPPPTHCPQSQSSATTVSQ